MPVTIQLPKEVEKRLRAEFADLDAEAISSTIAGRASTPA